MREMMREMRTMREMKKLLLIALISPLMSLAQQGPNAVTPLAKCIIPFTINTTSAGASGPNQPSVTGYDNRQSGCTNWAIYYSSTGYTVISLILQSAPALSNTAPGTPDTYVNFAGTVVSGINPNTAITQASSTFSGYFPWIRVRAATLTGSGTVVGVLIGTLPISTTGGSSTTTSCPNPCPVDGPTAAGAAPTTPPVLVAGSDATNIRTIITDTTGRPVVVGPAAEGAAAVGGPIRISGWDGTNVLTLRTNAGGGLLPAVLSTSVASADADTNIFTRGADATGTNQTGRQVVRPYLFNGATWDKQLVCSNQASFNLSGSGDTQIIALSGSTVIYICHISFSTTATEDIKLTRGTGANCATGNADVTGLYKSVQSMALDFGPFSPLRGAASGAICLNQSAVQALGGIVIYAQF